MTGTTLVPEEKYFLNYSAGMTIWHNHQDIHPFSKANVIIHSTSLSSFPLRKTLPHLQKIIFPFGDSLPSTEMTTQHFDVLCNKAVLTCIDKV